MDTPNVEVVEVPPNVVFPEPSKPAAWLTPPAAPSPPPWISTLRGWAPSSSYSLLSSPFAGGTVAVVSSLVALTLLRERARRRSSSFARELADFSAAATQALATSTITSGDSRGGGYGSLQTRAETAERHLEVLKKCVEQGLDLSRRFPGKVFPRRGEDGRKFQACARDLSRRRAKVERARKELRVMEEVEQLLARLDGSGGNGGEGDSSSGEGDRGTPEDSDSDSSDSDDGIDGWDRPGGADGRRRRRVRTRDERQRRRRRPAAAAAGAARLETRVSLLLSNPTSRRNSDSVDNESATSGAAAGIRAYSRCVFREELRRWSARLKEREQEAVDRLKMGLKNWDLVAVDRALKHLRLLELPEIVKEFQKKREVVRGKRWRLREELKVRGGS